jgi:HSP20 family protein
MVARWSPMTEFTRLFNEMDRLLSETIPDAGFGNWSGNRVITPPINLYDTGDDLVLMAAIPGTTPENLDVSIEQNVVTIAGSFGLLFSGDSPEQATWYRRELGSGQFQRRIALPVPVESNGAQAHYEHGILRLTLPKAAQARVQKIAVHAPQALTSSAN